jgi:hypothetical protein
MEVLKRGIQKELGEVKENERAHNVGLDAGSKIQGVSRTAGRVEERLKRCERRSTN